jgi:hypothetical protein
LIFAAAATSVRTEEQAVDGHPLLALGAARSDADCPVPLAAETGEVEGPDVVAELGDAAKSVTMEIETTTPDRTRVFNDVPRLERCLPLRHLASMSVFLLGLMRGSQSRMSTS